MHVFELGYRLLWPVYGRRLILPVTALLYWSNFFEIFIDVRVLGGCQWSSGLVGRRSPQTAELRRLLPPCPNCWTPRSSYGHGGQLVRGRVYPKLLDSFHFVGHGGQLVSPTNCWIHWLSGSFP